jgi:hypothetical protein
MLARQEEVEHPVVLDPDTNIVHCVATPLSSPSNIDTHSTPATTADSLPSHYTIEVDADDLLQEHPLEDWIRFDPDLHRTSIQIPATEAEPHAKVPACFIRFRVEPITGEPTIYGTMGVGRPIYAESLEAAPASLISSASGMERGEVFCGLTDWLGSCDPMTHTIRVLPSPRPWDFPPSINGDVNCEDSPMELDEPEGAVSLD